MEIFNTLEGPFNFEECLQPLFDAMNNGAVIKSITCMKGTMNKNNPENDFTITDFVASDYWVGVGANRDKKFDYVLINKQPSGFYMNWVRSFELY